MNELQVLSAVHRQLAKITTVSDAKDLRDRAEALRRYYKASKAGLQAQNQAAYVKLLCERRAGELLLDVPRKQGKDEEGLRPMLVRSGIPWPTAQRWQLLARCPEEQLTQLVAFCNDEDDELTSLAAIQSAKAYLENLAADEKADRDGRNTQPAAECSPPHEAGSLSDATGPQQAAEKSTEEGGHTTDEPDDTEDTAPVRADSERCRLLIDLFQPAYALCDLPEFASMRSTLNRWLKELQVKEQSRWQSR